MSKRLPTWREIILDTAPEIEAIMHEKYRQMSLSEKIAGAERLNRLARQFAVLGMK